MTSAIVRRARSAIAAACITPLAACAYNPTLGRDQFLLVNDAALAQSAQQAWAQTLATSKVSQDRTANARVQRVASSLVKAAGIADRSWEYVVFDSPQANAFVLPGGRIGVNTGLLALTENDDQLAAVLGHELAHSVANHAAERYSQAAAAQLALGAGQAAIGGRMGADAARQMAALGSAGAQVGVLLPFSRRHELEADRLGVDYMVRAGYRPDQAVALWRRMQEANASGRPPQFLSTHPSEATRIAELERYIASRGWETARR